MQVKTAVALGFFDGVHFGHKEVILKAVRTGLFPIVLTFRIFDKFPNSKKGYKFLNSNEERFSLIESLGVKAIVAPRFEKIADLNPINFVDYVLIKHLNAKVITCGCNFRFGSGGNGNVDFLTGLSFKKKIFKIDVVNLAKCGDVLISSSKIRDAIKSGNLDFANKMLGHDYFWSRKVFKVLYFSNSKILQIVQKFPKNSIVPKYGIYESEVLFNGLKYRGTTNIKKVRYYDDSSLPISQTDVAGFEADFSSCENVKIKFLKIK